MAWGCHVCWGGPPAVVWLASSRCGPRARCCRVRNLTRALLGLPPTNVIVCVGRHRPVFVVSRLKRNPSFSMRRSVECCKSKVVRRHISVVSRFRACVAVLYDVRGAPWRGEGSTRGGGTSDFTGGTTSQSSRAAPPPGRGRRGSRWPNDRPYSNDYTHRTEENLNALVLAAQEALALLPGGQGPPPPPPPALPQQQAQQPQLQLQQGLS